MLKVIHYFPFKGTLGLENVPMDSLSTAYFMEGIKFNVKYISVSCFSEFFKFPYLYFCSEDAHKSRNVGTQRKMMNSGRFANSFILVR